MTVRVDDSVQFPVSEARAVSLHWSLVYAYTVRDIGSLRRTQRLAPLCVFEPMWHM